MERLCNNGLTYPINSQSALRRNKSYSQICSNGISPATNQHIPIPRHGQTSCPEQVPFDWNIPFLPELSNRYSVAPQSYFQDLNAALPSHTTRAIQTSAQTVPGMDPLSRRNVAGEFHTFSPPPTKQSDISRLRVFSHALIISPLDRYEKCSGWRSHRLFKKKMENLQIKCLALCSCRKKIRVFLSLLR